MRYSKIHKIKCVTALFVFIAGLGLMASPAQAQRVPGSVGIGGQFGEPSGFSLKFYNGNRASPDFMAAWDFEDYVFLDAHAIYERHIDQRGNVHFYFGPGAFLELHDRPENQDDDVDAGLSGKVGLGFVFNRFEIFGHVTPRLQLTPSTDGEVGGGIGFRFYL